ncbi:cytochrome b [Pseudomonas turukhanskensis]|uniref:Cytochrome b n=2 Tax=Pseudomonas turukhanskensis TaxID=1806536 RepID=A0A9W6K586_9PSED|nr:cytochrome b [Pseudomonas turukhanskensis]
MRSTVETLPVPPRATPAAPRYSPSARRLHWLMAGLVILAYVLITTRGWFPKGSALKTLFVQGHFWVGLVVLALVLPRVLVRLRRPVPAVTPPLKPPVKALATLTHVALYGFLLLQPLLGVLVVLLERGGIPLGSLLIASPFELNKGLAHTLENLHVWMGTAFYYVIGLHVVASIWHHVVVRDDVLKRML